MAVGGLILALPIALILMEHDVGSVLTYLPILAIVLFLSAIRMRRRSNAPSFWELCFYPWPIGSA